MITQTTAATAAEQQQQQQKQHFSDTGTQFTYWLFFTYPFLNLWSLSPDSIITNLYIFLSLSYSFLLVAGWWLSYAYIFSHNGKTWMFLHIVQGHLNNKVYSPSAYP